MNEDRPRRISYGSREWNEMQAAKRDATAQANPEVTATGEYEWHVMGAATIQGVQNELTKRSNEGWEFVSSHYEIGGTIGGRGNHILIFRRHLHQNTPES